MLALLLSDDLMFTSRITWTGSSLGIRVVTARSAEQLKNLVAAEMPRCLLLDLQNSTLQVSELLSALPQPRPFVVGYGSHVDTATLQAARQAGCDLVVPRSKFVEMLPTALPDWCAASANPSTEE
jgi:CheY-like chemotaxis protein